MLQDRINELGSAILDIKKDKVYITGFTSEDMLHLYQNKDAKNWSAIGLYGNEDLEFHNILDNALIIVQKDGKEIGKHQYKRVMKETVQFKNEKEKKISRTFIVRKSTYSDHYHFHFVVDSKEKETDEAKQSLLFDNKDALDQFLLEKFNFQLQGVD